MNMKAMEDLRKMLCREVEEIADKGTLTAGDLETAHKLTDTIKNIDKICYLEDEGSYSEHGGSYADGGMNGGGSYNGNGRSYARNGEHYVRGHYSRAPYRTYSRHDGGNRETMMYQLGEMMESADDRQREIIRRALEELRLA